MKMKSVVVALTCVALLLAFVSVSTAAALQEEVTIVKIEDKVITVKRPNGEEVASKISSKRTKIMQGSDEISREDLEVGDVLDMTYVIDGEKNEPSVIKYLRSK
jgi:hypothetical protein